MKSINGGTCGLIACSLLAFVMVGAEHSYPRLPAGVVFGDATMSLFHPKESYLAGDSLNVPVAILDREVQVANITGAWIKLTVEHANAMDDAVDGSHSNAVTEYSSLVNEGVASFRVTLQKSYSSVSLLASVWGLEVRSLSFSVHPSAAHSLEPVMASSGIAGRFFDKQLEAAIKDQFGNVVTASFGKCRVSKQSGFGSLSPAENANGAPLHQGNCKFEPLFLDAADTYTFLFEAISNDESFVVPSATASISISLPPASLQFVGADVLSSPSSTVVAGRPVSSSLKAQIQDSNGAIVTTLSGKQVSCNILGFNESTMEFPIHMGEADLSTLSVFSASETSVTLTCLYEDNLDSVLTQNLLISNGVSPGLSSKLKLVSYSAWDDSQSPFAIRAGIPMEMTFSVQDSFGNSAYLNAINRSNSDVNGAASAVVEYVTDSMLEAIEGISVPVSESQGKVVVGPFELVNAGLAKLTVTIFKSDRVQLQPNITNISWAKYIRVSAAIPARISLDPRMKAGSVSARAGLPLRPAPRLLLLDSFGNLVVDSSEEVTVQARIQSSNLGSSLAGNTKCTFANGLCSFWDLKINKIGEGQSLVFETWRLNSKNATHPHPSPAILSDVVVTGDAASIACLSCAEQIVIVPSKNIANRFTIKSPMALQLIDSHGHQVKDKSIGIVSKICDLAEFTLEANNGFLLVSAFSSLMEPVPGPCSIEFSLLHVANSSIRHSTTIQYGASSFWISTTKLRAGVMNTVSVRLVEASRSMIVGCNGTVSIELPKGVNVMEIIQAPLVQGSCILPVLFLGNSTQAQVEMSSGKQLDGILKIAPSNGLSAELCPSELNQNVTFEFFAGAPEEIQIHTAAASLQDQASIESFINITLLDAYSNICTEIHTMVQWHAIDAASGALFGPFSSQITRGHGKGPASILPTQLLSEAHSIILRAAIGSISQPAQTEPITLRNGPTVISFSRNTEINSTTVDIHTLSQGLQLYLLQKSSDLISEAGFANLKVTITSTDSASENSVCSGRILWEFSSVQVGRDCFTNVTGTVTLFAQIHGDGVSVSQSLTISKLSSVAASANLRITPFSASNLNAYDQSVPVGANLTNMIVTVVDTHGNRVSNASVRWLAKGTNNFVLGMPVLMLPSGVQDCSRDGVCSAAAIVAAIPAEHVSLCALVLSSSQDIEVCSRPFFIHSNATSISFQPPILSVEIGKLTPFSLVAIDPMSLPDRSFSCPSLTITKAFGDCDFNSVVVEMVQGKASVDLTFQNAHQVCSLQAAGCDMVGHSLPFNSRDQGAAHTLHVTLPQAPFPATTGTNRSFSSPQVLFSYQDPTSRAVVRDLLKIQAFVFDSSTHALLPASCHEFPREIVSGGGFFSIPLAVSCAGNFQLQVSVIDSQGRVIPVNFNGGSRFTVKALPAARVRLGRQGQQDKLSLVQGVSHRVNIRIAVEDKLGNIADSSLLSNDSVQFEVLGCSDVLVHPSHIRLQQGSAFLRDIRLTAGLSASSGVLNCTITAYLGKEDGVQADSFDFFLDNQDSLTALNILGARFPSLMTAGSTSELLLSASWHGKIPESWPRLIALQSNSNITSQHLDLAVYDKSTRTFSLKVGHLTIPGMYALDFSFRNFEFPPIQFSVIPELPFAFAFDYIPNGAVISKPLVLTIVIEDKFGNMVAAHAQTYAVVSISCGDYSSEDTTGLMEKSLDFKANSGLHHVFFDIVPQTLCRLLRVSVSGNAERTDNKIRGASQEIAVSAFPDHVKFSHTAAFEAPDFGLKINASIVCHDAIGRPCVVNQTEIISFRSTQAGFDSFQVLDPFVGSAVISLTLHRMPSSGLKLLLNQSEFEVFLLGKRFISSLLTQHDPDHVAEDLLRVNALKFSIQPGFNSVSIGSPLSFVSLHFLSSINDKSHDQANILISAEAIQDNKACNISLRGYSKLQLASSSIHLDEYFVVGKVGCYFVLTAEIQDNNLTATSNVLQLIPGAPVGLSLASHWTSGDASVLCVSFPCEIPTFTTHAIGLEDTIANSAGCSVNCRTIAIENGVEHSPTSSSFPIGLGAARVAGILLNSSSSHSASKMTSVIMSFDLACSSVLLQSIRTIALAIEPEPASIEVLSAPKAVVLGRSSSIPIVARVISRSLRPMSFANPTSMIDIFAPDLSCNVSAAWQYQADVLSTSEFVVSSGQLNPTRPSCFLRICISHTAVCTNITLFVHGGPSYLNVQHLPSVIPCSGVVSPFKVSMLYLDGSLCVICNDDILIQASYQNRSLTLSGSTSLPLRAGTRAFEYIENSVPAEQCAGNLDLIVTAGSMRSVHSIPLVAAHPCSLQVQGSSPHFQLGREYNFTIAPVDCRGAVVQHAPLENVSISVSPDSSSVSLNSSSFSKLNDSLVATVSFDQPGGLFKVCANAVHNTTSLVGCSHMISVPGVPVALNFKTVPTQVTSVSGNFIEVEFRDSHGLISTTYESNLTTLCSVLDDMAVQVSHFVLSKVSEGTAVLQQGLLPNIKGGIYTLRCQEANGLSPAEHQISFQMNDIFNVDFKPKPIVNSGEMLQKELSVHLTTVDRLPVESAICSINLIHSTPDSNSAHIALLNGSNGSELQSQTSDALGYVVWPLVVVHASHNSSAVTHLEAYWIVSCLGTDGQFVNVTTGVDIVLPPIQLGLSVQPSGSSANRTLMQAPHVSILRRGLSGGHDFGTMIAVRLAGSSNTFLRHKSMGDCSPCLFPVQSNGSYSAPIQGLYFNSSTRNAVIEFSLYPVFGAYIAKVFSEPVIVAARHGSLFFAGSSPLLATVGEQSDVEVLARDPLNTPVPKLSLQIVGVHLHNRTRLANAVDAQACQTNVAGLARCTYIPNIAGNFRLMIFNADSSDEFTEVVISISTSFSHQISVLSMPQVCSTGGNFDSPLVVHVQGRDGIGLNALASISLVDTESHAVASTSVPVRNGRLNMNVCPFSVADGIYAFQFILDSQLDRPMNLGNLEVKPSIDHYRLDISFPKFHWAHSECLFGAKIIISGPNSSMHSPVSLVMYAPNRRSSAVIRQWNFDPLLQKRQQSHIHIELGSVCIPGFNHSLSEVVLQAEMQDYGLISPEAALVLSGRHVSFQLLSRLPASISAGNALGFTVQAVDSNSEPASAFHNQSVEFEIRGNSSTTQHSAHFRVGCVFSQGKGSVLFHKIPGKVGYYNIIARHLTIATSLQAIKVTASLTPSTLSVSFAQSRNNSGLTIVASASVEIQLKALDSFGNVSPTSKEVQVNVLGSSSIPASQIQYIAAVRLHDGVALHSDSFNFIAYNIRLQARLLANSTTVAQGVSLPFSVVPGAVERISFLQKPKVATVGKAISPIVVIAEDFNGFPAFDSFGTLSIASASNNISNCSTAPFIDGIAVISGCTFSSPLQHSIVATGVFFSGVLLNATDQISVGGSPAALAVVQQPLYGVAGSRLSQMPVVEVRDVSGNPTHLSADQNDIVVASLASEAGLVQSQFAAVVDGRASFSSLAVNRAGENLRLSFSLAVDSSTTFSVNSLSVLTVVPGQPKKLKIIVQPASEVFVGQVLAPSPQVAIADNFGNQVANQSVSIMVSAGGTQWPFLREAIVRGTTTTNTDGSIAIFNNLILLSEPLSLNLLFSVSGNDSASLNIESAISESIQVRTGSIHRISILRPSVIPDILSGSSLSVAVAAVDLAGNIVQSQSSGSVTVEAAPSAGLSLTGTTTASLVDGVAQFSAVSLTRSFGSTERSLLFSFSSASPAVSNVFFVSSEAQSLNLVQIPMFTVSGSEPISPLIVEAVDSSGNRAGYVNGPQHTATVDVTQTNVPSMHIGNNFVEFVRGRAVFSRITPIGFGQNSLFVTALSSESSFNSSTVSGIPCFVAPAHASGCTIEFSNSEHNSMNLSVGVPLAFQPRVFLTDGNSSRKAWPDSLDKSVSLFQKTSSGAVYPLFDSASMTKYGSSLARYTIDEQAIVRPISSALLSADVGGSVLIAVGSGFSCDSVSFTVTPGAVHGLLIQNASAHWESQQPFPRFSILTFDGFGNLVQEPVAIMLSSTAPSTVVVNCPETVQSKAGMAEVVGCSMHTLYPTNIQLIATVSGTSVLAKSPVIRVHAAAFSLKLVPKFLSVNQSSDLQIDVVDSNANKIICNREILIAASFQNQEFQTTIREGRGTILLSTLPKIAGTYSIRLSSSTLNISVTQQVVVGPGKPARGQLETSKVSDHGQLSFTCRVLDAHDNPVTGTSTFNGLSAMVRLSSTAGLFGLSNESWKACPLDSSGSCKISVSELSLFSLVKCPFDTDFRPVIAHSSRESTIINADISTSLECLPSSSRHSVELTVTARLSWSTYKFLVDVHLPLELSVEYSDGVQILASEAQVLASISNFSSTIDIPQHATSINLSLSIAKFPQISQTQVRTCQSTVTSISHVRVPNQIIVKDGLICLDHKLPFLADGELTASVSDVNTIDQTALFTSPCSFHGKKCCFGTPPHLEGKSGLILTIKSVSGERALSEIIFPTMHLLRPADISMDPIPIIYIHDVLGLPDMILTPPETFKNTFSAYGTQFRQTFLEVGCSQTHSNVMLPVVMTGEQIFSDAYSLPTGCLSDVSNFNMTLVLPPTEPGKDGIRLILAATVMSTLSHVHQAYSYSQYPTIAVPSKSQRQFFSLNCAIPESNFVIRDSHNRLFSTTCGTDGTARLDIVHVDSTHGLAISSSFEFAEADISFLPAMRIVQGQQHSMQVGSGSIANSQSSSWAAVLSAFKMFTYVNHGVQQEQLVVSSNTMCTSCAISALVDKETKILYQAAINKPFLSLSAFSELEILSNTGSRLDRLYPVSSRLQLCFKSAWMTCENAQGSKQSCIPLCTSRALPKLIVEICDADVQPGIFSGLHDQVQFTLSHQLSRQTLKVSTHLNVNGSTIIDEGTIRFPLAGEWILKASVPGIDTLLEGRLQVRVSCEVSQVALLHPIRSISATFKASRPIREHSVYPAPFAVLKDEFGHPLLSALGTFDLSLANAPSDSLLGVHNTFGQLSGEVSSPNFLHFVSASVADVAIGVEAPGIQDVFSSDVIRSSDRPSTISFETSNPSVVADFYSNISITAHDASSNPVVPSIHEVSAYLLPSESLAPFAIPCFATQFNGSMLQLHCKSFFPYKNASIAVYMPSRHQLAAVRGILSNVTVAPGAVNFLGPVNPASMRLISTNNQSDILVVTLTSRDAHGFNTVVPENPFIQWCCGSTCHAPFHIAQESLSVLQANFSVSACSSPTINVRSSGFAQEFVAPPIGVNGATSFEIQPISDRWAPGLVEALLPALLVPIDLNGNPSFSSSNLSVLPTIPTRVECRTDDRAVSVSISPSPSADANSGVIFYELPTKCRSLEFVSASASNSRTIVRSVTSQFGDSNFRITKLPEGCVGAHRCNSGIAFEWRESAAVLDLFANDSRIFSSNLNPAQRSLEINELILFSGVVYLRADLHGCNGQNLQYVCTMTVGVTVDAGKPGSLQLTGHELNVQSGTLQPVFSISVADDLSSPLSEIALAHHNISISHLFLYSVGAASASQHIDGFARGHFLFPIMFSHQYDMTFRAMMALSNSSSSGNNHSSELSIAAVSTIPTVLVPGSIVLLKQDVPSEDAIHLSWNILGDIPARYKVTLSRQGLIIQQKIIEYSTTAAFVNLPRQYVHWNVSLCILKHVGSTDCNGKSYTLQASLIPRLRQVHVQAVDAATIRISWEFLSSGDGGSSQSIGIVYKVIDLTTGQLVAGPSLATAAITISGLQHVKRYQVSLNRYWAGLNQGSVQMQPAAFNEEYPESKIVEFFEDNVAPMTVPNSIQCVPVNSSSVMVRIVVSSSGSTTPSLFSVVLQNGEGPLRTIASRSSVSMSSDISILLSDKSVSPGIRMQALVYGSLASQQGRGTLVGVVDCYALSTPDQPSELRITFMSTSDTSALLQWKPPSHAGDNGLSAGAVSVKEYIVQQRVSGLWTTLQVTSATSVPLPSQLSVGDEIQMRVAATISGPGFSDPVSGKWAELTDKLSNAPILSVQLDNGEEVSNSSVVDVGIGQSWSAIAKTIDNDDGEVISYSVTTIHGAVEVELAPPSARNLPNGQKVFESRLVVSSFILGNHSFCVTAVDRQDRSYKNCFTAHVQGWHIVPKTHHGTIFETAPNCNQSFDSGFRIEGDTLPSTPAVSLFVDSVSINGVDGTLPSWLRIQYGQYSAADGSFPVRILSSPQTGDAGTSVTLSLSARHSGNHGFMVSQVSCTVQVLKCAFCSARSPAVEAEALGISWHSLVADGGDVFISNQEFKSRIFWYGSLLRVPKESSLSELAFELGVSEAALLKHNLEFSETRQVEPGTHICLVI